jgi:hypothetical protein
VTPSMGDAWSEVARQFESMVYGHAAVRVERVVKAWGPTALRFGTSRVVALSAAHADPWSVGWWTVVVGRGLMGARW